MQTRISLQKTRYKDGDGECCDKEEAFSFLFLLTNYCVGGVGSAQNKPSKCPGNKMTGVSLFRTPLHLHKYFSLGNVQIESGGYRAALFILAASLKY